MILKTSYLWYFSIRKHNKNTFIHSLLRFLGLLSSFSSDLDLQTEVKIKIYNIESIGLNCTHNANFVVEVYHYKKCLTLYSKDFICIGSFSWKPYAGQQLNAATKPLTRTLVTVFVVRRKDICENSAIAAL